MGMTPDEQGIFYVLIVGGGPGAGEFTYDASGNLRSANVGQVTTDPVQGITCQQGFSTFNGHGAVINLLSTSKGAFFQYQDLGTSTQGPIILAVASAAGTDPVTSFAYQAGMTGIDPVFGDEILTVGATINLLQVLFTANAVVTANTGSGATSPFISVAGPEQGHAGHAVLRIYGVSADGTKTQGVIISGADPPVRVTQAMLEIQGITAPADPILEVIAKAAGDLSSGTRVSGDTVNRLQIDSNGVISWGPGGGTAVDTTLSRNSPAVLQSSQLNLSVCLNPLGAATPAAPGSGAKLWADTSGFLRMLSSLAGDTNAYFLGRNPLLAKNTSQVITTTGAITGLSCPVGIGTYRIRARLLCQVAAGGTGSISFNFTGPALGGSPNNGRLTCLSFGESSTLIGAADTNAIGAAALMAVAAFAANIKFVVNIDGWYNFSAAGTLALNGNCTVGNTFTVIDGTMDVEPVI